MSCLLSRHGIESASHARLDACSGIFVHGAGGSDFVQLLDQRIILLFRIVYITSRQRRFKVLDLSFDHAPACTVLNPSFGILPNSFFG